MNVLQRILQSKTLDRAKRSLGKTTGLHLRLKRFTASASEEKRTSMLLQHLGIQTVIDIGANTGQFAEGLYDFGFEGRVISFEPVPEVYFELQERARAYPQWTVAERCAVGEKDGEIEFHITDDTVFSSVLPIKDDYVAHNQKSRIVATEMLPIYRLDTILPKYLGDNPGPILLKIDTQGYEKQVIAGAQDFIHKVKGIKIEIPLYAMYENTGLDFYTTLDFLRDLNMTPYSFNIEGVDLHTGRVNTIDGLFFKSA